MDLFVPLNSLLMDNCIIYIFISFVGMDIMTDVGLYYLSIFELFALAFGQEGQKMVIKINID